MKKFFLYLLFGIIVFSCKSKKEIVTKTEKTNTEKVAVKENNTKKMFQKLTKPQQPLQKFMQVIPRDI